MESTRAGADRQVAFADVEQHHHRLLGEEPEAADRLLVVRIQVLVADRRARVQARLQASKDDPFVLGGLALGLRPVAAAADQSLQPSVRHGEVGHEELEVEALEVPGRIDAALGVRDGGILERADHVEQRIGVPQPREVIGRQLLGPDVALGRRRGRGQVHVRDVGLDDLLRLEDAGQRVQPGIGDLDDPDVQGDAAVPAGLGVAPGERVEDGRLARSGKTDDGDLHRRIVAGISTRRSDPRR